MKIFSHLLALLLLAALPATAQAALPPELGQKLLRGYDVMMSKAADLNGDRRTDYIIVERIRDEASRSAKSGDSPPRPLLVFLQGADHHFTLLARNNAVVMGIRDGGQCDPFMDSEDGIVAKGTYFTVQNAVSCGTNHWSDYVTFRYSANLHAVIFVKRIFESLVFNPDERPGADVLIPGPRNVTTADRRKPVRLQNYRGQ